MSSNNTDAPSGSNAEKIELEDGAFYHLDLNGDELVFGSQDAAVEHLRQQKDAIDLDDPDVTLALVETGDEWAIESVPWQTIALQLL